MRWENKALHTASTTPFPQREAFQFGVPGSLARQDGSEKLGRKGYMRIKKKQRWQPFYLSANQLLT
jgi:hypothetical protein